ncbi:MAG: 3-methyl-2-oxobutanoate hydroxymethyltransferase [Firmicutes bacterium]|nr:3-methyl-2-oxobutanoate hydroxymethyltransferase [Bacillota bacterium]
MLTAYDYPSARVVDSGGVDVILVGDSLGMVVLGYDNTLSVTMEDMLHHTKAVVRGSQKAMVVFDMPFLSYHVNREEALRNAGRAIQEAGAQAVKLEGGQEVAPVVETIVKAGIPVMGHIGLTPQSIHQLGGFKVQGKDESTARKMIDDARALEQAGAFSIVLETVPWQLARIITGKATVPTIGIGAGLHCDGQVLVTHDLLGIFDRFAPKFVRRYANLYLEMVSAVERYVAEVGNSEFPAPEHTFSMKEELLEKLK